jgi:CubicO group peptidase (beta-lactamase class C family)
MLINGNCAPEFASVRSELERNFSEREETGAACCIYHRGRKVVDLWGGDRSPECPWGKDTLALTFSVTKGMAAAALVVAHSRGLFELDVPVARYWPEFAQGGKDRITVRQLLCHQAGLISVDDRLTVSVLSDHEQLAQILARQKPAWPPGTRHGYHTLTLGWYQSALLRRVDPLGRSIGQFFHDEIARPLGVSFYIGLPDEITDEHLAVNEGFHRLSLLRHLGELPIAMVLSGIWPRSLVARSVNILRLNNPAHVGNVEYRRVEIPAANGFGQARAIAKVYSVLAGNGRELKLAASTRRELAAPAATPVGGSHDAILKFDTRYGFGFSRPSLAMKFGLDASAFGCPGAGGSFGMADPQAELGFAYVTNKMGYYLFDDPRERACRQACYASLASMRLAKRAA